MIYVSCHVHFERLNYGKRMGSPVPLQAMDHDSLVARIALCVKKWMVMLLLFIIMDSASIWRTMTVESLVLSQDA